MDKFGDYMKGCIKCVDTVDKAIEDGSVVLSREEKFDYLFKTLLVYRCEPKMLAKSKLYRKAYFLSICFNEIKKIYRYGYDNRSAVRIFRKINTASMLLNRKFSFTIEGGDENGTMHIYIDDLNDKTCEMIYDITDGSSLVECIEDFVEYLMSNTKGVTVFESSYITRVLNDVYGDKEVVPYTNMSPAKTLGFVISEENTVSNLVQFVNTGGVANGRNERGIFVG